MSGDDEAMRRFTADAPDGDRVVVANNVMTESRERPARERWADARGMEEVSPDLYFDLITNREHTTVVAPENEHGRDSAQSSAGVIDASLMAMPEVSAEHTDSGSWDQSLVWMGDSLWLRAVTQMSRQDAAPRAVSSVDRSASLLIDALSQFSARQALGDVTCLQDRKDNLRHDLVVPQ
jgi:hypothetical protein